MSTLEDKVGRWPDIATDNVTSKHEKCRHITEEIYKRINITFQIKNLETGSQSDVSNKSDQIEIDSNELSNETDLFAYEKSDSIPSSVSEQDATRSCDVATRSCDKLSINLNNNEIKKSVVPIYKPPRKRLRKKVKKRQSKVSNKALSEGSSDEAPLSRIVVESPKTSRIEIRPAVPEHEDSIESADNVMGVPKISILTTTTIAEGRVTTVHEIKRDPKQKSQTERAQQRAASASQRPEAAPKPSPPEPEQAATVPEKVPVPAVPVVVIEKTPATEWRQCTMCSMSCRGERGLRRHMSLSHILIPDDVTRPKPRKSFDEKTV